jgi:hypothetical protein
MSLQPRVSPDSAGIPSEDRLTAEDKDGLTTLFWGISAGPSNPRSGPRRSVRSATADGIRRNPACYQPITLFALSAWGWRRRE